MDIEKTQGWDAKLASATAMIFGDLRACYEAHGWPVPHGQDLLRNLSTHIKETYSRGPDDSGIETFARVVETLLAAQKGH